MSASVVTVRDVLHVKRSASSRARRRPAESVCWRGPTLLRATANEYLRAVKATRAAGRRRSLGVNSSC